MRTTVEELIKELQQCDPKSAVVFQTGVGDSGPVGRNGLARVDRFAHRTVIVVENCA